MPPLQTSSTQATHQHRCACGDHGGGLLLSTTTTKESPPIDKTDECLRTFPAQRELVYRCTSRTFDLLWIMVVLLGGCQLWGGPSGIALWVKTSILALLLLPAALLVDGLVYALFGNTLARWWLGMKLRTREGGRLSAPAYLRRNGWLWVFGFGCGVVGGLQWAMACQYLRLKRGKPARYDQKDGWHYAFRPVAPWRETTFALVYGGAYFWANTVVLAWFAEQWARF